MKTTTMYWLLASAAANCEAEVCDVDGVSLLQLRGTSENADTSEKPTEGGPEAQLDEHYAHLGELVSSGRLDEAYPHLAAFADMGSEEAADEAAATEGGDQTVVVLHADDDDEGSEDDGEWWNDYDFSQHLKIESCRGNGIRTTYARRRRHKREVEKTLEEACAEKCDSLGATVFDLGVAKPSFAQRVEGAECKCTASAEGEEFFCSDFPGEYTEALPCTKQIGECLAGQKDPVTGRIKRGCDETFHTMPCGVACDHFGTRAQSRSYHGVKSTVPEQCKKQVTCASRDGFNCCQDYPLNKKPAGNWERLIIEGKTQEEFFMEAGPAGIAGAIAGVVAKIKAGDFEAAIESLQGDSKVFPPKRPPLASAIVKLVSKPWVRKAFATIVRSPDVARAVVAALNDDAFRSSLATMLEAGSAVESFTVALKELPAYLFFPPEEALFENLVQDDSDKTQRGKIFLALMGGGGHYQGHCTNDEKYSWRTRSRARPVPDRTPLTVTNQASCNELCGGTGDFVQEWKARNHECQKRGHKWQYQIKYGRRKMWRDCQKYSKCTCAGSDETNGQGCDDMAPIYKSLGDKIQDQLAGKKEGVLQVLRSAPQKAKLVALLSSDAAREKLAQKIEDGSFATEMKAAFFAKGNDNAQGGKLMDLLKQKLLAAFAAPVSTASGVQAAASGTDTDTTAADVINGETGSD